MIILKSWLEDYISIPWDDERLVSELTDAGSLVDSYYSTLDSNIVIGEIKEIRSHPNADKLRLARVWNGQEDKWVVCGAPNIEAGQKVPLAQIGAKIGEIIITEAVIRGERSHGMLCSEFELGLGNNHEGILILPDDSEPGKPLSSLYPSDLVLDLEITPNRGDCLSHLGIAREVSSILKKSFSKEPISLAMCSSSAPSVLSVEVKDKSLCPEYFARVINNVKIGTSPEWLVERLGRCGVKSINNVVDITNYIMLDLGQPLHAFDASQVVDGQIVVRKSAKDEQIITLDGELRSLPTGTILIADREKPLSIAGVMGGKSSEITASTTTVVLEAAQFDQVSIRKISKSLGLVTDASYRFERGVDPGNIEYALNKAAKMISEIAGGSIMHGIVKSHSEFVPNKVELDYEKINCLLGTSISCDEIKKILKYRGFKCEEKLVEVPTWRHDVSLWQDLAEEVMCIYGIKNIKPVPVPKTPTPKKSAYYFKEHLKDILVDAGFSETFSYSFMSETDIKTANLSSKDLLIVDNPVSPENRYMRNSLMPGLLMAVAKNPTFDPIQIFEIGNVFTKKEESTKLCIASSGAGAEKRIAYALEQISKEIKLSPAERAVNCLSRESLAAYKIKKPVVFLIEIDLTNIEKKMKVDDNKLKLNISNKEIIYRPISKYPSITRDLAFIVDKQTKPEEVSKSMYGVSDLIINVELFDEFVSDKFGQNKKNIAYHLYLQAPDRTLKDNEAEIIVNEVVKLAANKFKAKFRDK